MPDTGATAVEHAAGCGRATAINHRCSAAASASTAIACIATNGVGDVGAFEAATGKLIWRQHPAGPIRGAPSIALGNIYVTTQDNQIFAIAGGDGKVQWNEAATLQISGRVRRGGARDRAGHRRRRLLLGRTQRLSLRKRAERCGQDALSRTSISTAVSSLSDIDADPVIDSGVVYAIGDGGRMVALGLTSGQRQWEVNIAGISTPWVAGDWLFVVTDNAQLLCVARSTGKVRWIRQLAALAQRRRRRPG